MKYLHQCLIILAVSLLGELLHALLPLPVPGSIYGIVLMFLALELKIVRVRAIKEVSGFLLDILPLLFLPSGVGLMDKWDVFRPVWLPFLVIVLVSTFLVMAAAGHVSQAVIRRSERRRQPHE